MKALGLIWDWTDWSLSRRLRFDDRANCWAQMFALKCCLCRRWTFGCKDHWFCGVCEDCRYVTEPNQETEP